MLLAIRGQPKSQGSCVSYEIYLSDLEGSA